MKHPETLMIPLVQLRASNLQPRKHFNEERHAELVQSMKEHGFTLSTILVRPMRPVNGAKFEIVVGERRVRAARAAGIDRAPCYVMEYEDSDALAIQLVENLQRDDLTPIEEANGYHEALRLRDDKGDPKFTIESLAKRTGKAERTIRERLPLVDLPDEAKREVEAGNLPPITALLIARVPDDKMRLEAARIILHPTTNERADCGVLAETGPLTKRAAMIAIHRKFVRDLRQAEWLRSGAKDDSELVPVHFNDRGERTGGGACADCPFRHSERGTAVCTNPPCFEAKEKREWQRWQERQTIVGRNRVATTREESLEIYPSGNQLSPRFRFVDLNEWPAEDLRPGILRASSNWRALTKGKELKITVTRDRLGKLHELVNREAAIEAARQNGHDIFKTPQRIKPPSDEKRKEEEHDREKRGAIEKAAQIACVAEVRKHVNQKTIAGMLRLQLDREIEFSKAHSDFCKRNGLPIGSSVALQVARRSLADLVALLVEFVISEGGFSYDSIDADRILWLKNFGVDHAKIQKRILKEAKKK